MIYRKPDCKDQFFGTAKTATTDRPASTGLGQKVSPKLSEFFQASWGKSGQHQQEQNLSNLRPTFSPSPVRRRFFVPHRSRSRPSDGRIDIARSLWKEREEDDLRERPIFHARDRCTMVQSLICKTDIICGYASFAFEFMLPTLYPSTLSCRYRPRIITWLASCLGECGHSALTLTAFRGERLSWQQPHHYKSLNGGRQICIPSHVGDYLVLCLI